MHLEPGEWLTVRHTTLLEAHPTSNYGIGLRFARNSNLSRNRDCRCTLGALWDRIHSQRIPDGSSWAYAPAPGCLRAARAPRSRHPRTPARRSRSALLPRPRTTAAGGHEGRCENCRSHLPAPPAEPSRRPCPAGCTSPRTSCSRRNCSTGPTRSMAASRCCRTPARQARLPGPDEAGDGEGEELPGVAAVLVDLAHIELNGTVLLGWDQAVSRRALARDVQINNLALVVLHGSTLLVSCGGGQQCQMDRSPLE